jgi:LmbE family N-acetylglucosaminyl deacetylase
VRRLRLLLSLLFVPLSPLVLAAQLEPPSTGGYAALDRALRLLGHQKRVLMIAAHPDDEDTELLTVLVRGMGAEAGYLSLNRGEGGQNLIGNELGEALGLLRTEELLAARRLDGAQQFFTRAYDFGFSKNLTDTWNHWPQDSVLKDVVRTVRRFRPQIVVSIFSGTPRDGHGQHQAAGWAAREAFRVAGDSAVFPELLTEEGLPPYTPLKFYRSTRFDTAATTLTLDGGSLDPAVGQSFHQIAMRGRSLHRSQDMGQLQGMGPSRVRLQLVEDRTGQGGAELWGGVDTTLAGLPLVAALGPDNRKQVAEVLARYVARVDSARTLIAGPLRAELRALLDRAERDLSGAEQGIGDGLTGRMLPRMQGDRARDGDLLQGEVQRLDRARIGSLDLVVDGVSEDSRLAPGQQVRVTASLWNASDRPVEASLCLGVPAMTWQMATDSVTTVALPRSRAGGACLGYDRTTARWQPLAGSPDAVPPRQLASARLTATIPEAEDYSTPYFLRLPRNGDLYQWGPEMRAFWGLPFEEPRLTISAQLPPAVGGGSGSREITYRGNDQGSGEFRRPVVIVPRVDVRIEPELEVWPLGSSAARSFTVRLIHGGRDTISGVVVLRLPAGWAEPPPRSFRFTSEDQQESFTFTLRPPRGARPGLFEVTAMARDDQGRLYDVGLVTVDHPHIHARSWARRSAATVRLADLRLPRLRRMAYLRGAADRVPEALLGIGLPVDLITAADLSRDLSRYDVIVVGPRAFETDPDLPASNGQLLAFARGGGAVIVQYQQYGYFLGNFAPFPLTVGSRPPGVPDKAATTTTRSTVQAAQSTALLGGHDRVTDESAPVTVVDRRSPILRVPNRITTADWDGWVQERGLYFAHTWSAAWKPVVEMHDPGDPPLEGGLLVARVGRGTYVYTGIAFFRQLPAGVPGAWRLFANLLALRESRVSVPRRTVSPGDSAKVERE